MESMRGDFVTKSQEAEEYNRSQGEPNKATNDNEGLIVNQQQNDQLDR